MYLKQDNLSFTIGMVLHLMQVNIFYGQKVARVICVADRSSSVYVVNEKKIS